MMAVHPTSPCCEGAHVTWRGHVRVFQPITQANQGLTRQVAPPTKHVSE